MGYAKPVNHVDTSRKPSNSRRCPTTAPLCSHAGLRVKTHRWIWKLARDLQGLDQSRLGAGFFVIHSMQGFPLATGLPISTGDVVIKFPFLSLLVFYSRPTGLDFPGLFTTLTNEKKVHTNSPVHVAGVNVPNLDEGVDQAVFCGNLSFHPRHFDLPRNRHVPTAPSKGPASPRCQS